MTIPVERNATSRRAALAKARQSRRPSRLGIPAGATAKPDYVFDDDAGFPRLLRQVWQKAGTDPHLPSAVHTLLTLDGYVPSHIQLRALESADEAALKVLFGLTWRAGDDAAPSFDPDEPPAFLGELGLAKSGRIRLRVPSQAPLRTQDLVDGVLHVPWPAPAVLRYQQELVRATERFDRAAGDCRAWLAAAGPAGRDELLELLKDAALRTAPFVLYQGDKQYTNFRDRNTLTGKTLWPGHPDCALSSLQDVPLELWSDHDVVLVVCLTLLVRSASYARIEEANGTQLTLDHVAHLLERTRAGYNAVPGGELVAPAASARVQDLDSLARALGERRNQIKGRVQLYREIHGALMHKIERIARPPAGLARQREQVMCARLLERLPVSGETLADLGRSIEASPGWLARPHGEFGTGLESVVYETVRAAREAFDTDFAMSRGMRSIPQLIRALRAEDWEQLTSWELPEFFCCVVPAAEASRYFDGSRAHLADTAWAISSRMQFNSWHFIAGNVPKVPVVVARDYFVPPTIPDIAFHSDQHHHGHVASNVRFSIRSPQSVEILGRPFNGFVDVRLLRCGGPPFEEQDLLAAHQCSAFVAAATQAAAGLVADGEELEVTSFDSQWHWQTIADNAAR